MTTRLCAKPRVPWNPGAELRPATDTTQPRRVWGLRLFSAIFLTISRVACADPAAPADFDAANKLYEQSKFAEAAASYEKLLRSGQASESLYFNWGNALFKNGQIGRAIAAYQQAQQMAPRDPDVRANLQFARNQVQGPTRSLARWQRAVEKLTLNEWTGLAAASVW